MPSPRPPISVRAFRRSLHLSSTLRSGKPLQPPSFPCLDQHDARTAKILSSRQQNAPSTSGFSPSSVLGKFTPPSEPQAESGPEPSYSSPSPTSYHIYTHNEPFPLVYSSVPLPNYTIAYETWGKLNEDKSNAILLHTGLSASSHAKSTEANPEKGWWEKFIGPGKALDTDQYFVICCNVLGGCYGSTGPSSPFPEALKDLEEGDGGVTSQRYGSRFPLVSLFDNVRAQFNLLDELGIEKLYASVGSSMGGMSSIASAHLSPERVGRIISISGTGRSSPSSIALRYAQRSVLMADPNWKRGFYYEGLPPHTGMKLARQIATITYRSGPEWESRFARRRRDPSAAQPNSPAPPSSPPPPVLCPDYLIETYLDHQGEQFCLKYDANSLIYISKAMDLFDMSFEGLQELETLWKGNNPNKSLSFLPRSTSSGGDGVPHIPFSKSPAFLSSLTDGMSNLKDIPTLVIGVQSDVLFPVEQQRELAQALRGSGNKSVVYYELDGPWGHDTFLIDTANVGGAIRGFLSQSL